MTFISLPQFNIDKGIFCVPGCAQISELLSTTKKNYER